MMKTGLIHLFLLATLIMATGCAGIQEVMQNRSIQKRASIAYAQVESTCGQCRGPHYENGWITGYTEVANGSEGKKRPFAPSKYHGPRFQTDNGRQFVMNWHEGYELGIQYALETNADAGHIIPSLGNVSLPESEPLVPDWYFANNQLIRPDYELEEIALPEMKKEADSNKDDESGSDDQKKSETAEDSDDGGETTKANGSESDNDRQKEISPSDIITEPAGKAKPISPSPKADGTKQSGKELIPPKRDSKTSPESDAVPDSKSGQPEIGTWVPNDHRGIKPAQFNRNESNEKKTIFPSQPPGFGSNDSVSSLNATTSNHKATQVIDTSRSPVVTRRISDQKSSETQQQPGRVIFQFNKDKQEPSGNAAPAPSQSEIHLDKGVQSNGIHLSSGNSLESQTVRMTSLETMVDPKATGSSVKQPSVQSFTIQTIDTTEKSKPEPVNAKVTDRRSSRRVRSAE